MRRVSRLAVALAAAALLVAVGWRSQAPQVQHATVPVRSAVVELWRDPVDGELALHFQGSGDWTILRRRTLYDLIEGRVIRVTVYSTAARAWKPLHLQYGLTSEQADAALGAGDQVDRPPLMNVPRLDRTTRPYLFARDFGTDVRALRKAARFPVPSPGLTLAGLRLADVALTQTRGPGRLVDGGYVANLHYSTTPDRPGTGEHQLSVEAASPRSGAGESYRMFFTRSRSRVLGPGYDARLTDSGAILRYHGIYVLVFPRFDVSLGQLRAVLSKVGRS